MFFFSNKPGLTQKTQQVKFNNVLTNDEGRHSFNILRLILIKTKTAVHTYPN